MPKLDLTQIELRKGSTYPAPFDKVCEDRTGLGVSDAGGLTQFGAHLMTLAPGSWSSQRHHHSHEDEIVYIISGRPTLYEGDEATTLSPGDITVHPMNDGIGHHIKNETDEPVTYFVVGGRNPASDNVVYPDIDLALPANGTTARVFQTKSGTPY